MKCEAGAADAFGAKHTLQVPAAVGPSIVTQACLWLWVHRRMRGSKLSRVRAEAATLLATRVGGLARRAVDLELSGETLFEQGE